VGNSQFRNFVRRQRRQIDAGEADAAGAKLHQARDRAQRGALAGAVGAQEADGFAFTDLDTDIGDRGHRSVTGADAAELEH